MTIKKTIKINIKAVLENVKDVLLNIKGKKIRSSYNTNFQKLDVKARS